MCGYLNASPNNLEVHGCRGSQSGQAITTMQSRVSSSYCITSYRTAHVNNCALYFGSPLQHAMLVSVYDYFLLGYALEELGLSLSQTLARKPMAAPGAACIRRLSNNPEFTQLPQDDATLLQSRPHSQ